MVYNKHGFLHNHAIYCNKCTLLLLSNQYTDRQSETHNTNYLAYLHFGEYYGL